MQTPPNLPHTCCLPSPINNTENFLQEERVPQGAAPSSRGLDLKIMPSGTGGKGQGCCWANMEPCSFQLLSVFELYIPRE